MSISATEEYTYRVNADLLESKIGHEQHQFSSVLREECERLARWMEQHSLRLELAAKALFQKTHDLANTNSIRSVHTVFAALQEYKQQNRNTVQDCLILQEAFTLNRTTLLDLAELADRNNKDQQQEQQQEQLVRSILPRAHVNSSLVCIVSDTFESLRQAEQAIMSQSNSHNNDTMWQAPSSFERTTTKYWVHDEKLTKLMMTCAAEAPLLVYGKKGPLTSLRRGDLNTTDGDKLWDSLATRITSIYFDSSDMSLYKERLKRTEGAQLLRARWYGKAMPKGDKIIFVELKTHHEKWVTNKSVKERALVLERDMVDFLQPTPWTLQDAQAMVFRAKPDMKQEAIPKACNLLLRMHNLVVQHKLTACVRSVYDRAAFQSSTSNDLRLTLDRNVTLVDERCVEQSKDGWCLSDDDAEIASARVVPFNVFEIKLASDDDMPAGFTNALQDGTLLDAPKFSKFLTGAAAFNTVPTLPYWAAHTAFYNYFDLASRGVPRPEATSSHGDYVRFDTTSHEAAMVKLPDGVAIAPRKPPRIEPKTFFANERTFIQWISASILLISVSGFMLSAGDFRITAAVISLCAFGLMVYSTVLYFDRLMKLKERHSGGYYNRVSPIVLTCVVGVAVFLVFSDSIKGSEFLSLGGIGGRRILTAKETIGRRALRHVTVATNRAPKVSELSFGVVKDDITPSSLLLDSERNALLVTWNDSVYMMAATKLIVLARIHRSHLQGMVYVGDRLFAVSNGAEHPELVELAWWKSGDGEERLQAVGRWTLQESRGRANGFAFVPFGGNSPDTESPNMGSFYVQMDSSMVVYSIPRNEGGSGRPSKLKSLNMKVLNHGEADGRKISTMHTFEGITYILNAIGNVLEAWDMSEGSLLSEIELPSTGKSEASTWTDFALERRKLPRNDSEISQLRGSVVEDDDGLLFLHLMSRHSQLWSFPVVRDSTSSRKGLFSVF